MTLNSRPLTYVSSDDLDEALTPSHLMCGFRVLSLPDVSITHDYDNYTPRVSKGDLTRRMRHLNKVLTDFWSRWRTEYLLELREAHRFYPHQKGIDSRICVGDVVLVHDENLPRGLWRLGRVEQLMVGTDGNVRGAAVRVVSKGQNVTIVNRPIQRLYPLEFSVQEAAGISRGSTDEPHTDGTPNIVSHPENEQRSGGPRRRAFHQAQDRLRDWCKI